LLITDKTDFEKLREQASVLVDRDKTYPEYVFRKKNYRYYYAMESSVAVEYNFLSAIAEKSNDTRVALFHFHPHGDHYWIEKCNHYGAAVVKIAGEENEWWDNIYNSPSSLCPNLDFAEGTAVIFGSSLSWCIFRHYSFDLSILATDFDLHKTRQTKLHQYVNDAVWAIDYWKGTGSRMNNEFYVRFLQNYSPKNNTQ
jgi:hypothetical protein